MHSANLQLQCMASLIHKKVSLIFSLWTFLAVWKQPMKYLKIGYIWA